MRFTNYIVVAGLLFASVQATAADSFETASSAFDRGAYEVAMQQFAPLAAKGDANALMYMGVMYEGGLGVSQDSSEAMVLFRRAAAAYGHALSPVYLSRSVRLFLYWRVGANKGDAHTQFLLGIWHYKSGHPTDYVQAYKWLTLADSPATYNKPPFINLAIKNRDELAARMTEAQIDAAKRLVNEWKPHSQ